MFASLYSTLDVFSLSFQSFIRHGLKPALPGPYPVWHDKAIFFFFFCYSLQITHHLFSLSFQPLVWYGLQPALPRSHPVWHNRRQKWVQLDGRSPGSAGVLRGHHLHRVLHHDGHVVHQQARLQRDTSLRSLGPSMYKTEHVHIFFYFKCVAVSIFRFSFMECYPLGSSYLVGRVLSVGSSNSLSLVPFFIYFPCFSSR